MKRITLFIFIIMILGLLQNVCAQCYLLVENPGNLDTKAITQISLVQISQHFEIVNEIPPQGLASDACTYNLSVAEIANGILVTIKGRKVSTYGDSKLRGFDGFQQALFRAIISAKPEEREPICQRYYNLMAGDCSGIIATPTPAPTPTSGKLVARVPYEYRYAQIFSSGLLVGDMSGETVKEFEVDTNVSLSLKAIDGVYQSDDVYVTVQPNIATRVDFRGFKSTEQPRKEPQPTYTPTPEPVRSDERDFGENGAFVFGFSLLPVYNFSAVEEDAALRKTSVFEGTDTGTAIDMFIEFFINQNLGLGSKLISVGAESNAVNGSDTLKSNTIMLLFTVTVWFPLSTKNKGYSHFGLNTGVGSANYNIKYDEGGTTISEWEAKGSATMFGAFFDWGGDIFGGRIGYMSITTELGKSSQTTYDPNYFSYDDNEYDADYSGSGFYITMRWGF